MKGDDILDRLKRGQADLQAQGVLRAALFGSAGRDQQREDSDIDILVELDPEIVQTIIDYVGVKDFLAEMFGRPIDVVSLEGLKPALRSSTARDAIYAF